MIDPRLTIADLVGFQSLCRFFVDVDFFSQIVAPPSEEAPTQAVQAPDADEANLAAALVPIWVRIFFKLMRLMLKITVGFASDTHQ